MSGETLRLDQTDGVSVEVDGKSVWLVDALRDALDNGNQALLPVLWGKKKVDECIDAPSWKEFVLCWKERGGEPTLIEKGKRGLEKLGGFVSDKPSIALQDFCEGLMRFHVNLYKKKEAPKEQFQLFYSFIYHVNSDANIRACLEAVFKHFELGEIQSKEEVFASLSQLKHFSREGWRAYPPSRDDKPSFRAAGGRWF